MSNSFNVFITIFLISSMVLVGYCVHQTCELRKFEILEKNKPWIQHDNLIRHQDLRCVQSNHIA